MEGAAPRYQEGERVRVRLQSPSQNPRTPDYLKGKVGVITALHGVIENSLDHREVYPYLYTLVFDVTELFGGHSTDKV